LTDAVELTAERIVAGGDALARAPDGRVVLVEGALPGERVTVDVQREQPDLIRARTVAVLEAAPDRIVPPCEYVRAGCGGCTWQHIRADAQPALKRDIVRDALRHIARIEAPEITFAALPATGYRTTVRAAVSAGRAGFRRRHSHEPVAVDTCMVAHPLVDELLRDGRFGDAQEVTIRAAPSTGECCVSTLPTGVHVDVPDHVRTGPTARVHEVIDGRRLRVSAGAFFQSRADGAALLAQLVRDAVGPDRRIADLYCGVGLFAATVCSPRSIVAVENNPHAVADAQHNLHTRPARVLQLNVERWRPEPVDVVIADPSRAGLGRAGAHAVVRSRAERVVLVSCDAAALARDARLLVDAGYDLDALTLVDLFPHTPHVECVTVFVQKPRGNDR